jgi:hypothetical protein
LRRSHYEATGTALDGVSIRSALDLLEAGDERWRAVEIGPDGWRVIGFAPVRFRRPAGMLPRAERGAIQVPPLPMLRSTADARLGRGTVVAFGPGCGALDTAAPAGQRARADFWANPALFLGNAIAGIFGTKTKKITGRADPVFPCFICARSTPMDLADMGLSVRPRK